MSSPPSVRGRLLAWLAIVTPLGFATKLYVGPGSGWMNAHAGGVLYVVFWVPTLALVWPRMSPWRAASLVLAVTCLLEFLQLFSTPTLQAIRGTFLGHALIGSTFGWWDLPHYALGALAGAWLLRRAQRGRITPAERA